MKVGKVLKISDGFIEGIITLNYHMLILDALMNPGLYILQFLKMLLQHSIIQSSFYIRFSSKRNSLMDVLFVSLLEIEKLN